MSVPRVRHVPKSAYRRAHSLPVLGGLVSLFALAAACGAVDGGEAPAGVDRAQVVSSTAVVIELGRTRQHITGFGASSAWMSTPITDAVADLFFTEAGIGLSLLRLRIAPEGSTWETGTALEAQQRGAKIWAAPWSPPGAWKTNGSDRNGGSLLPEYYDDWAELLATFAAKKAEEGIPIYALSAQNEPNWTAEWETCRWTPEELRLFIRDHLGPALRRESPETLLMAPETIDWNTVATYMAPLFDDPVARDLIGIVATHSYGGQPYPYRAPAEHGKEFWETEISYDDQTGILATLATAREVHEHLVVAEVNAFHYWWLIAEAEGSLMRAGELTPQAYGLAHFSKFVRPGYVRLEVVDHPHELVWTSAYSEPQHERVVVVAVNENTVTVEQAFRFDGAELAEIVPWTTVEGALLVAQPAQAFKNPFVYALPPQSVTTLVFTAPPDPDPGDGEGGQGHGGSGAVAGAPAQGEGGSGQGGAADAAGAPNEGGASGDGSAPPEQGGSGGTGTFEGGNASIPGGRDGGTARGGSGAQPAAEPQPNLPGMYSACYCAVPRPSRGSEPAVALLALFAFGVARRRRSA